MKPLLLALLLVGSLLASPVALAASPAGTDRCDHPVCDLVNEACLRAGLPYPCVLAGGGEAGALSTDLRCGEGEPCYWINEACERVFGNGCIPAADGSGA